MAANITQTPVLTAAAYNPMVYVVSGITTQDRYVLRVYAGNIGPANLLATFKQPANPAGVGIFDISIVIQSYMNPVALETTQRAADTTNAHFTYQVEAYLETGQEQGIIDTDQVRYAINSYDNWRVINPDYSAFQPNPGDILCETNGNTNARYVSPLRYLTNYPETYSVRPDEYKTLSFFAKNYNLGPNWGPNEAPFFVSVKYYNTAGTEVAQGVYALSLNNGSTLRTDCDDMGVTITDDNNITTIAAGPQNMIDDGITWDNTWASYKVEVYSYNHCLTTTIQNCASISEMIGYLDDVIYTATFNVDYDCEKFTPVTISFMNQYGVLDYYTFNKRNTKQVNTQRNEYTKALGSWSSTSFAINNMERGQTVFSSSADTQMTISSNWMTDGVSEWLQELYASPYTNAYVNGRWEPIVITTQTYEEKTYAREQLFQHELTIKFANNQKIQRG